MRETLVVRRSGPVQPGLRLAGTSTLSITVNRNSGNPGNAALVPNPYRPGHSG